MVAFKYCAKSAGLVTFSSVTAWYILASWLLQEGSEAP